VNRIQALALATSLLLAAPDVPSLSGPSVTIKDVRNASGNILVVVNDESNFGKTRAGESENRKPGQRRA
jgi:hypothetical protein